MRQPLHKLFLLVVVINTVFFSSCKKKEEVNVRGPVVTLKDVNADKVEEIEYAYESGDKIPLRLTASMPGKFQSGTISTTIIDDDLTTTVPLTGISVGNEDIDTEILVDVTADTDQEFIIKVTLTDQNGRESSAEAKYQASSPGVGGGGTVPLVKTHSSSTLNTDNSPYLSAATKAILSPTAAVASPAKVDFFFGYTEANGSAKKANGTAGTLSMISTSESTTANGWANLTNGKLTKIAPSKVGLVFYRNTSIHNIRAIALAEDNTANTGTTAVAIEAGKTYSFITADGKKGYILIESIEKRSTGTRIKVRHIVQE